MLLRGDSGQCCSRCRCSRCRCSRQSCHRCPGLLLYCNKSVDNFGLAAALLVEWVAESKMALCHFAFCCGLFSIHKSKVALTLALVLTSARLNLPQQLPTSANRTGLVAWFCQMAISHLTIRSHCRPLPASLPAVQQVAMRLLALLFLRSEGRKPGEGRTRLFSAPPIRPAK